MSGEYTPARILRDGHALSLQFANCPNGTRMALDAAAEHAETAEKMRREVSHSVWATETIFGKPTKQHEC